MTMMTASGMIWLSSYCSRWWEKPSAARLAFGSPPAPNQVTPKPGQISTIVASRHRIVGRSEQIHAPAMPNGTRYGRWTSGREYRSLTSAGRINRYEIVVVEMVSPRTAEKYLAALPPVIWKAAIVSAVATRPERTFIEIGVPNLAENLPKTRGPAPSSQATAWLRSGPRIQAVPALARAKMKTTATIRPRTSPAPVSVAPLAETLPPYTVNTDLMESRNPVSPDTSFCGSTIKMARIGLP